MNADTIEVFATGRTLATCLSPTKVLFTRSRSNSFSVSANGSSSGDEEEGFTRPVPSLVDIAGLSDFFFKASKTGSTWREDFMTGELLEGMSLVAVPSSVMFRFFWGSQVWRRTGVDLALL